ncbi:murein DD-endopeptidase MepM/ murein hydrolase activator NlpD [Parabacteroides sp. PF5-5]|uniref:LysM peptidoglycan-binding domain-containing protein n=1 Tax=unclassified Parabacteroides TaxID=2649774 RepID=UPI002474FAC3|nr:MULTISPECIES: LysM peptidoglycan-binding domain-containing protein [unclassified Parabacteroides]MDH6303439.1 murein DD-endopeptidase MepM/ murein hydrolase activator NlpD [Parabacteroides sp. PH5-39]MDH6314762.1 murein DD-endopeptidase MepM/ murein hydrolase activator NlpD [Parabacteroides sp. PF5-13]MDH6318099.1 murein DD-endopeptidase MepM/ murein hydrolase activator NlpD [Parabacteroides sp. PH5-13]MDH6321970.1 murein DD-endopeptidase MepM/ murein hydrolase activator NlpD [Parabacteroide
MNIRLLLLYIFCAIITPTFQIAGQDVNPKLLDEHVSELMADRVIKTDIALEKIATLEEILIEEEEDLLFPADELYGSNWDNRWVDPYKFASSNITFPDSCEIDCSTFILPVDCDLKVTSKYGPRRRRMHRGIDLKVQIGDTIRAAFAGKVRIRSFERRGYGNYLVVRHPNGLETVYGHLSKFIVDVNDIVRAGDPIALGGNTGRSTGSHLHFETRFLGKDIDPSEIVDFEAGVPHKDLYVFRNLKVNGRSTNIYTSSTNQLLYHRVKSGDTLGAIARKYGTTVGELCRLNGLKPTSTLRIGQSIRCGIGKATATADSPKETKKETTSASAAKSTKTIVVEGTSKIGSDETVYHRIQAGDTLGAIAKKYGITVGKLCELNNISKTTVLKLGRSLKCS